MEFERYTPTAVRHLRKYVSKINKIYPKAIAEMNDVLDIALRAEKFIMPVNGRVFDDGLKILPDELNLPFNEIVIEFEAIGTGEAGLAETVLGLENTVFSNKRIAVAKQLEKGKIAVFVFYNSIVKGDHRWHFSPFYVVMTKDKEITQLVKNNKENTNTASTAEIFKDVNHIQVPIVNMCIPFGEFKNELTSKEMQAGVIDTHDESIAVLELIEVLSCSNVSHTKIKRKPTKGKGPSVETEYRMVIVKHNDSETVTNLSENKPTVDTKTESDSGSRKSPREHPRRGHIRHYGENREKKVFVPACIVNPGTVGKIIKDYIVH